MRYNTLFVKAKLLVAALLLFVSSTAVLRAGDYRNGRKLLSTTFAAIPDKNAAFRVGADWFPYPAYSDRAGWDKLFSEYKTEIIQYGEKYLDYVWLTIPATAYLEFERTGDRSAQSIPSGRNAKALSTLMFAELAEGKGRFIDQIINGLWLLTERTSWVGSAHTFRQANGRALPVYEDQFIDLGSGQTVMTVAICWHFFHEAFDAIDPSISKAIQDNVRRRVFDNFMDDSKNDENWWFSFSENKKLATDVINNWDPWCNADNIFAFLLMEQDQENLVAAVERSCKSVDLFLDYIKSDGACEEGPSYWGHASGKAFDFIRTITEASHGYFNVYDDPQLKRMGEYMPYSYVGDGWTVNFADASPRSTGNGTLIWEYADAVGSQLMKDYSYRLLLNPKTGDFRRNAVYEGDDLETLENFRSLSTMKSEAKEALALAGGSYDAMIRMLDARAASTWYPETEFAFMRNRTGWMVGAKGGNNNEAHNHNDIGSFVLYVDNIPMLVDSGTGVYRRQTFGPERYTIWTMQSGWHNAPVINGCEQKDGAEYKAEGSKCNVSNESLKSFSTNIAGAYPAEACCKAWTRSILLSDNVLTVEDKFNLSNRKAADEEHFLVWGDAKIVKPGEIEITCNSMDGTRTATIRMTYPKSLKASTEIKLMDDANLKGRWGESLKRIVLKSSDNAPLKGGYKIIFTKL